MALFGKIMDKIFHRKRNAEPSAQAGGAAAQPVPQAAPQSSPQAAPPTQTQPVTTPAQSVDVGAVLGEMAAAKGGGGNYKTSIVDLLKLLELDSDLGARRELAEELGVNAGEHGSAEQNIALHKAVMAKLADNGGIVPDDLRN